jgi:hypothetical protein
MELEKPYKIYVDAEKITFLHEIMLNMPLIITKDKNLSNEMEKVFVHQKKQDIASKVAAMGANASQAPSQINKHDPHL